MRSWTVPLLFAGAVGLGIAGCPGGGDDTCMNPGSGLLTVGSWGGEHWLWQVSEDGTVYLETDCAHGTSSGPVLMDDGHLSFYVDMVGEGGPVQEPPPEEVPYTVLVTGEVCEDTITFTTMYDDGSSYKGSVVLAMDPLLYKCL